MGFEVVTGLFNFGVAVRPVRDRRRALAAPASGGAALLLEGVSLWAARATTAPVPDLGGAGGRHCVQRRQLDGVGGLNEYYHWATVSLDVVSLAGAAASASAAVRAAKAIERATGKSWTVYLEGMSRAERKRLAEELIRLKTPGVSGRGLKSLVRMGAFPKRLSSAEITERLFSQLKDAISATMALGGSGTSGVLKEVYVHIIQE